MSCTPGFVDNVEWAESEMTLMFRRVRQVAAPVRRQTTSSRYVWSHSPDGMAAPGAKHVVSHWPPHLVLLDLSRLFFWCLGLGSKGTSLFWRKLIYPQIPRYFAAYKYLYSVVWSTIRVSELQKPAANPAMILFSDTWPNRDCLRVERKSVDQKQEETENT